MTERPRGRSPRLPEPMSYWVDTAPHTARAPLEGEIRSDCCVVGGGVLGFLAAILLKEAGLTVTVLEAREIGRGVTGHSTAKVTSGHGVIYSRLRRSFGADGARIYGTANEAGRELIEELVARYEIDCDLERQDNFVYTELSSNVARLEAEAGAAREAGLPASFVADLPLPYEVRGAVKLEHQAQFHPRRFVVGLAEEIPGDGSEVFEGTMATAVGVREGLLAVETDGGRVIADDVIVATHLPFLDRGLFFAKAHPHRSYAVAGYHEDAPEGMHISDGGATRSIRAIREGDRRLLLVGGEGHKTGHKTDTNEPFEKLARFARERFGLEEISHRWATHDYVSVDHVPYVGRVTRGSENILTATGFGKWGFTNGAAAAIMLRDLILGHRNDWMRVFDSKRIKPLASAASFAKENGDVAFRFVADRVDRTSPRCTHLGCVLKENLAEDTWDCPCHGSRFTSDGKVIQGPATADLKQVKPRSQ